MNNLLIEKGRIADLLMSSRHSITERKKSREYQANLVVFKSNMTNAFKVRSGCNVHEEEKEAA